MKCDEEGCHEMAMTSILKDLFGKSDAMRNLCSKHAPRYSAISADPLLGLRGHSEDIARLEAALKVVRDMSIAHAGKQNDRIRALEAALIKIASNGRAPNESRAFNKVEYRAGYVAGFERQADIARAALALSTNSVADCALNTTAETPAEQWPCPNCGNRMTHAMDCLTRNREFCQMSEPRNTKPTIDELERILNNPDAPEIEITPAGEVVMKGLRHEIERAINRVSGENGSNTPDFILAEYLVSCLAAFDRAIHARERWYGYAMHVAMPDTISRPYPPTASLDGELLAEVDPCRTDISKGGES